MVPFAQTAVVVPGLPRPPITKSPSREEPGRTLRTQEERACCRRFRNYMRLMIKRRSPRLHPCARHAPHHTTSVLVTASDGKASAAATACQEALR